jgi:hypothetical protein
MNEADTCRTLITPKLRTAGWTDEQIREQVTRKVQKRADYLLYYRENYKIAVVEAKDDRHRAVDGLPQANKFATNEHEILESNFKSREWAKLNLSDLQQVPIPVPPLDEQRRIVAYLNGLPAKVNALRELQAESGKELSALMLSILDKAFKGEL